MPATPGVILTDYRTGGSFLSLCLDSHPLIFCARGEPLARRSGFYRFFPDLAPEQILQHIFKTEFCKVAFGKVIYRQAGGKVWKYLSSMNAKVIHLIRENTLRAACSYLFHVSVMRGEAKHHHPLHHFGREPSKPVPMRLDPHAVLEECRKRERQKKKARQKLAKYKLDTLVIYYEHMCGGHEIEVLPEDMGHDICTFLDQPYYPMSAPFMHRVNAQWPLSELIANWRQVKALLTETEMERWLNT